VQRPSLAALGAVASNLEVVPVGLERLLAETSDCALAVHRHKGIGYALHVSAGPSTRHAVIAAGAKERIVEQAPPAEIHKAGDTKATAGAKRTVARVEAAR